MLVFDLGNTRAHFATTDRGRLGPLRSMAYPRLFGLRFVGPVVYASVNPAVEARFERRFRALKLGRDVPVPIRNRTRRPSRVGADRLANGVAAWARAGRACVAVDIGTAVTFDVVDGRGDFVGGLIAPGPSLQMRSLHEHTKLLPAVRPRRAPRAIGRHTEEAIAAGVWVGVSGLIREGLARVRRELGMRPRVFGTGGAVGLFGEHFDEIVPALTLEGVAIAARSHGIR